MRVVERLFSSLNKEKPGTIQEFLTAQEFTNIVEAEGHPFKIMNDGFRNVLKQKGVQYESKFPQTPFLRPFAPVKVTRAGFLLNDDPEVARILIAETNSYHYRAQQQDHDPDVGDILLWVLEKNKKKGEPPVLKTTDILDDITIPNVILEKVIKGNKVHYSGYANRPVFRYRSYDVETIYEPEEVLKFLKTAIRPEYVDSVSEEGV